MSWAFDGSMFSLTTPLGRRLFERPTSWSSVMPKRELGGPIKFAISIKISVAVILTVLSLGVILAHVLFPTIGENLQFATAVIGGAAAIYVAYYVAISFQLNRTCERQRASFQIMTFLQDINQARIRILIENEVQPKHLSPDRIYQLIAGDEELLSAVTALLGLFEDVSVGIQKRFLDEEVLFYSLGFMVPWYFDKLRAYIDKERELDPFLFCETEKLRAAWKARRSLVTRREYKLSTTVPIA
jgi:hypothetical protein